MNWIFWASLATVLWGSGYVFLKPVNKEVNPLVIQILFGVGTFVCNLIAMGIWAAVSSSPSSSTATTFIEPWKILLDHRENWYLVGYVLCNAFAGLVFLYTSTLPDVPLTILTALTAAYPLVTTIIVFGLFREFDTIDLRLAIPGLVVTMTGTVLLALAPVTEE